MAIKEHGLKIREKGNTDISIGATVDYEKLMPGLQLTLDSSFQPNTGDKASKFKTEYKKLIFNANRGKAWNFNLIFKQTCQTCTTLKNYVEKNTANN